MYQTKPPQMLASVPDGPAGVRETLKMMRDFVRGQKTDPTIRDKATSLVFYIPKTAYAAKLAAIWRFVKETIKYIPDVRNIDTLQWPTVTLARMAGDCDDQAMLVAALLESIGVPTRFEAVGFDVGEFSHVYAAAMMGDGWVALETTEDKPFGWRPPGVVSMFIMRN